MSRKWAELEQGQRRAIGVFVILLAVLAWRSVVAVADARTNAIRAAVDAMTSLARSEQTIGMLPTTLDTLEVRLQQVYASSDLLVHTGSAAAASGAMADRLARVSVSRGIQLGNVEVSVSPADAPYLFRVEARGQAMGDWSSITGLLTDLQYGVPRIGFKEWSLTSLDPLGAATDKVGSMRLDFVVHGLSWRNDRTQDD